MRNPNLGQIVAQALEETLRETPDPFRNNMRWLYNQLTGIKGPSYRERLDHIPYNIYGERIPRIVTVRRNLRQLGNIRLDPSRLR